MDTKKNPKMTNHDHSDELDETVALSSISSTEHSTDETVIGTKTKKVSNETVKADIEETKTQIKTETANDADIVTFAKRGQTNHLNTESLSITSPSGALSSLSFKMGQTLGDLGKTFVGEITTHSGVFGLIVIISIMVVLLFKLPLMDHFELKSYDFRMTKNNNIHVSDEFVLVEIQDECIREFGQWPWPRTMHTAYLNILNEIYKPQMIGFDILFLDPSSYSLSLDSDLKQLNSKDKLIDISFSKSIASSGNVFLPGIVEEDSRSGKVEKNFVAPFEMFANNAHGTGHINYNVDADGTVRRVPLVIQTEAGFIPHLAFSMILDYMGIDFKDVEIEWGEKIEFKSINGEIHNIPIDDKGQILLVFPGQWGEHFKHVAYRDIRQAKAAQNFKDIQYRILPETLHHKILITGMGATTGSVDYKPTPVQSEYPLMGIHAVLMNQILNHTFIRIVSLSWNLGFCFLLAVLVGFFAMNYPPFKGLLLTVCMLGIVICISFIFLLYCDLWIEMVRPVITISLTYIILGTYSHVKFKDHVDLKLTFEQKLNMADALLPQFRPNLKIGQYKDIRELGRGGMAIVYEGTGKDHKKYAIKVINPDMLSKEGFKYRFKREIMTMKKVVHPNVIRVYESGSYQGVLYYAMELFPAGDLGEHITRLSKVTDYTWMKSFLAQLIDGLGAIHHAGLIHRDIKPANIMMNDKNEVKLADFGLAKSVEEGQLLTTVGQVLGTPAYLAPEACMGEDPDFSADIYAMGIVFYEILTGYRPFQECATMAVLMQAKLKSPIPPVQQKNPNIPYALAMIIDKMVSKNKNDRYNDTESIRDDLLNLNILTGIPI